MRPNQAYKDSPQADDRDEPLLTGSSDDVEGAATEGAGKPWTTSRYVGAGPAGQNRSICLLLRQFSSLIITFLLVVVIGLQLTILNQARERSKQTSSQWQLGGDYRRAGPIFPTEVKKWNPDYEFTPLNASAFLDPKVQAKWETLIPAGAGFTEFDDEGALTYNSTSVTHQIHCTYIMGKIFSAVLTKAPNMPEPEDYEAHFLHCVDYMRQAAMCSGDLAIEPRGENGKPGHINLVNAFNGLHVCKDYSKVKEYLEEQVKEGKRNILPLDD